MTTAETIASFHVGDTVQTRNLGVGTLTLIRPDGCYVAHKPNEAPVWHYWSEVQPLAAGDRASIPSGMGGTFDVKLLRGQDDGRWQVRVDMPRNPDWHRYLIDDVRADTMRSAHRATA